MNTVFLRLLVGALCMSFASLVCAASFTLDGTGSLGGSVSTGATNTSSGSACSLAGEAMSCLSGTLGVSALSGHDSFTASISSLPTGTSWTTESLSAVFSDPILSGGSAAAGVPLLGRWGLALLTGLLAALAPMLRRHGLAKGRLHLMQTLAYSTLLSIVFALGLSQELHAQPTPGSQTVNATVSTAALRQLTLTLNANGTLNYQAYIRTGTPPVMGDVLDQTVSGGAITQIDLANYVTQTEGDAILGYRIVGNLPSGLVLNGSIISGTPTASGSFLVQAQDRDGWSNTDSVSISNIVLNANFRTLPTSMTDATDNTVSGLAVPTTVNTRAYSITLTGKLRVTTVQALPASGTDSSWTIGVVQFANASPSIGTINITSVQCPFKLTVHHAPSTATDSTRQLLIKFGAGQVYLGGGGITGATGIPGYSVTLDSTTTTTTCTSGTTDISLYGWNGINSAGVRVYDLWIEQ